MAWWQQWMDRITGRAERDLDRELRAHLDLEDEEQQESGLRPSEAGYAARRAFGNVRSTKEETRAMWGWTSLERLGQDLRYAFRMLRKTPAFTAVILVSLTLGIGLNSSVFSVINALFIRPLPVPEPDRLVRIYQDTRGNTSYRNFRDLQARSETLESLAAFSWPHPVALTIPVGDGAGRSEQVWGAAVSANYFAVLGVQAQLGRTFLPDEDRAFIRRGLTMALAGIAAGLLAALAGTRLLTAYLYGVNPLSPATLTSVGLLLLFVAFVACYLPSRGAVRIEPLRALRHE